MIGKLFAQDFRSTRKTLFTVVGIVALVGAVSFAAAALTTTLTGALIGSFGFIVGVGAVLVTIPLLLALLVEYYWRTMYGREGYFTMSLPVSGRALFTSKVLYGLAVTLAGVLLTAVGVVVALVSFHLKQGGSWANSLKWPGELLSAVDPALFWGIASAIAVPLFFWVIAGAALMSVGAEARFNHLGFGAPVIGAIALYFVLQIVGLAAMLFVPLGIKLDGPDAGSIVAQGMWQDLVAELGSSSGSTGDPSVLGLGIFLVMVAGGALLFWWGARSVDRRTSLR